MIKLLHVEDDVDIREIAAMALELSSEFEVVQCESGDEALAAVETFKPDVFLLDMMMPGMTGRQVLEAMRQMPEFASTPAVFMTARAQHSEIEELLEIDLVEVISKPFDPMSLAEQIEDAMKRSLAKLG